jgi:hypothetical protein
MTTIRTRRAALALFTAIALGGAACGGDETSLEDLVQAEDGGGDGAASDGAASDGGGTVAPPVTGAPPVTAPPVTAGSGDVFQLQLGQCFDSPSATSQITDVPTVPCDQPHTNEVYAVFDLVGDAYPGDAVVQQQAAQGCLERFEPFVGLAYEQSVLDASYLSPNEQGWTQIGDREVICYIYRLDGTQVTGSLQGTAQ